MPTVLVVDDDLSIRELLSEILTLEGFSVHTAEHGGPALDMLRASTKGMVVLLGLAMPDVDGEAVLEAVVADEELSSRHAFVMVTGSTERATTGRVADLRERLGVPLVAKPMTLDHLLQAVDEAAHRLRRHTHG